MRISAEPKSRHYWTANFREAPTIRVDGTEQPFANFADDVEGLVIICETDAAGGPKVINGRFAFKALAGRVEIIGERRRVRAQ
jgi:hypothetical protein